MSVNARLISAGNIISSIKMPSLLDLTAKMILRGIKGRGSITCLFFTSMRHGFGGGGDEPCYDRLSGKTPLRYDGKASCMSKQSVTL